MSQKSYLTSAVAVGIFGGVACYSIYKYKKRETQKLPEQWTKLGVLDKLYAYPIKSCGPVVLSQAECTALGVRDNWLRDRVLLVVDEENDFIHARSHPQMLLIHPMVKSSILTLTHPKASEAVHVNLAEVAATQKPMKAKVWDVTVPVYDCGAEVSDWLTKIFGSEKYKLVYYASDKSRPVRNKPAYRGVFDLKRTDTGAFPDELSYNIINASSIDDLNSRLEDCKVSERNFRPNFVLKSDAHVPFDEDNWKYVKIGETIFEAIKPCARCIMTTIDPETGERDLKSEPMQTLKRYRQMADPDQRKASSNAPAMGIQMALRSGPGVVHINDPIYVAYK